MTEHYSDVTLPEKREAQRAAFGELTPVTTEVGGGSRWGKGQNPVGDAKDVN